MIKIFLKIRYYKYYNGIDKSRANDLAESNNNKEFMIFLYWFFNHRFNFQDCVCNGCHGLTMVSVNIRDIATITVKSVNYCLIHSISKPEAIKLLENSVLEYHEYL